MSEEFLQISPGGENHFLVRGFANRQKLMNHCKNGRAHRDEYPELASAEDYERKALSLLETAVGGDILGHVDGNGNVIRYNRRTNDFAKGNPLKGIRSMYRPENGEAYYWESLRGDLEHGGRK
jgi:hypothetical protein